MLTPGYSPVDDAISRLAAVSASTRILMTAGFVCFGLAVTAYGLVLRHHLGGTAWVAATTSGVATLGIALFPLGTSSAVDAAHNTMAGLGYVALVAMPLLATAPLRRGGHPHGALASLVVAALAAGCLAATLPGPAHGLYQRTGLTLVDGWLMASAATLTFSGRGAPRA